MVEVHSAPAKKPKLSQTNKKCFLADFCLPKVLVKRQQTVPEWKKLRWINSSCRLSKQPGQWENKWLGFSWLSGKPSIYLFIYFLHFFTLHSAVKMMQIVNRHWQEDFYKMKKAVYLQCLTCWVYTLGEKKFFFCSQGPRLHFSGPLNSCSWTSFNYHLMCVIKMFLSLFVFFCNRLNPSPAAKVMPLNCKETFKNVFSMWGLPSTNSSGQDTSLGKSFTKNLQTWDYHCPCHLQLSGRINRTNGKLD